MVDKLPSSKLYKILASFRKLIVVVDDNDESERIVLAHQYISIHNTKEHISTNNNVICIYYIAMYMYV